MPELPEVETVVRDLAMLLPGDQVKNIHIADEHALGEGNTPESVIDALQGKVIQTVSRRAKYIVIGFTDKTSCILHLRMTGKLILLHQDITWAKEKSFFRWGMTLASGNFLHFFDQRRFGRIWYFANERTAKKFFTQKELGIEPLTKEFSVEVLQKIVNKRERQGIKGFLLDQRNIVGIGNIYANEILWEMKLHPEQAVGTLKKEQLREMVVAIKAILTLAVESRGTSISDFVDALGVQGEFQHKLVVHGKENKPCPKCGASIKKIRIAQRGTYLCPNCQKLPKSSP